MRSLRKTKAKILNVYVSRIEGPRLRAKLHPFTAFNRLHSVTLDISSLGQLFMVLFLCD